MNFTFETVPEIIFETGAAARLGDIVRDRMKRPAVVTDKGVVEAGLIGDALKGLEEAGLDYLLIDSVEADPPAKIVKGALDQARAHKCDGVVGFGGGSSMDTAKVIAVLMNSSQALEEIYGMDMVDGDRTPLFLVPTTAGTGSEVTNISVVTSEDDQKMGIVARQLYGDLAILDASLTLTMPRHVTAATGIDAMVHAIEAYTSKLKKESGVGRSEQRSAAPLIVQYRLRLRGAGRYRGARKNAARRNARRPIFRERAGGRRARNGLSPRRSFPCAPRARELSDARAGFALQCASGRAAIRRAWRCGRRK